MASGMKITVSPSDTSGNIFRKGQEIDFINIMSDFTINPNTSVPKEVNYDVSTDINYVVLLDYHPYKSEGDNRVYTNEQGFAPIYYSANQTYDLFRREVTVRKDDRGNLVADRNLTNLELIGSDLTAFYFKDYKIANDRTYQYVFYPASGSDRVIREEVVLPVKWNSWSITELHPADSSGKKFYVSPEDVWLFKFNVETGEQNQNITRQENVTLGQYPRYYEGRQNYISGTVSCLLGSEMVSAAYLAENGFDMRDGMYREYRIFDTHPTSNQKVDMLKAWREFVKSKNPKLLKDRKGQIFIVAVTQSSNKPYDNIRNQPDVINFSWTQTKSVDDVMILSK